MRNKKLFSVLLVIGAFLLTGCETTLSISDGVLVETESISESVSESSDATEEVVEPEEIVYTGEMVRSPLTYEEVDSGIANVKPIAVMIPNNESALPHYNISNAGVLYECNVEYNITRLMAIIDNWQDMERIGNVRSTRDYYVYWAMEWDPLLIHYGNIWYADEILARNEVHNINGVTDDGTAFYRVTDENRIYEQTAYTSGKGILEAAAKLGYTIEHGKDYKMQHFFFKDSTDPETLDEYEDSYVVNKLDLSKVYTIDQPWFEYNKEDELYYRFEYGAPHMDAATNEQLSFDNVIVQFTYHEKRPDGQYLIYQCHDTSRDGYYFTRGKAIHITWRKLGEFGTTMYFDDNGKNVNLNQGKTMICIVDDSEKDKIWME